MYKTKLMWQERPSDSHIVESVWACSTSVTASRTVIADPCITISLVKNRGSVEVVIAGPKTKSSQMILPAGFACTSIRLKPGVFLKSFLTQKLIDGTLSIPADSQSRFRVEGTYLQFPDFDHTEQLIDQLYNLGYLGYEQPNNRWHAAGHFSARTYSRQLQRITGLSPYQLYQLQRMHQALRLLKQGVPASRVASELDFVDQSHFIHASKKFFGHTPSKLSNLLQTP